MARVVAVTGRWKIEIVKRSDLRRFVVLPKGGSSKGRSHGSVAIDALRVISNVTQPPSPPLFVLP